MNYTTSITVKGQITIPRLIRKKMNLKSSTKLSVFLDEKTGEIRVRPLPDFFELVQAIKFKTKKNVMGARKSMDQNYERF